MRLTLIIHSLDGGGAERVMAALASRLTERGHAVTLITLDDGTGDRHSVTSSVNRVFLDTISGSVSQIAGLGQFLRIVRIRRAVRTSMPDVVLSFCDATNVLMLLATRLMSVPVVVSERSDPAAQALPGLKAWLRPRLYRRAAAVVVLTPAAAATVAPWCRRPPVVIPSAVDVPPADDGPGTPTPPKEGEQVGEPNGSGADRARLASRRRLIAVGRLEQEKGFDRLLEAFVSLTARHPDWDLEIHGDGSLRDDLRRRISRLGIDARVRLVGWTRPIWPALRAADLFVLPSRYEGFPSALLEAMAVGLACVATDCPSGPREIIRPGIDGVLVPADNVTALAEGLSRLMGDESERARLGEAARQVVERFGWDAMTDAYLDTLRQAVAGAVRDSPCPGPG